VDNHKKTHTEGSKFKKCYCKEMWKLHYYISIALYLTDTWKKREKNMSGFKIISVHEYQNRTRLNVKQIYQLKEMLINFLKMVLNYLLPQGPA